MNQKASEKRQEKSGGIRRRFVLLGGGGVLVLFFVLVMILNSERPEHLTPDHIDRKVKGTYFVWVNQALIKQMYENWLPNDCFWPTALLDNMPNFQIGVLEVLRYNLRVLRDNLTRMRTTDRLDPYTEAAFTAIYNDPYKWWFPSAESKWKQAFQNLDVLYSSLSAGKSRFFPRADNLVELLSQYVSLMGGVNTRLINAPRDVREAVSLEGEKMGESGPGTMAVDIPWSRIDDNFYYAQGVAFALYESFKAIEADFEQVLRDKNSVPLVRKILELLKRCEFEPLIVLNGDPDSVFANHSLNLSGVFNDARQKMNSLIIALMQG